MFTFNKLNENGYQLLDMQKQKKSHLFTLRPTVLQFLFSLFILINFL